MVVDLFQPYRIGKLELRNRFVRSATNERSADGSGRVTEATLAIYRELGRRHIGLIVSGFAFVSVLGKASPGQYGAHSDEVIPGLRQLTKAVHNEGGKIALQIMHCGLRSDNLTEVKTPRLAVSALPRAEPRRVMAEADIEAVISEFAAAAWRGREAGFDAVQFHGAHGYLLSQFLSPQFNLRTDAWGGSPANRRRFLIEVTRRSRRAVGQDFPLMIKLGVHDSAGVMAEAVEAAMYLEKAGIDAIEVSALVTGLATKPARKDAPERVYFRSSAAAVKRSVTVPVMVVGGIRSLEMAQNLVDSGDVDLISMSRPFIRQPGLIAGWEAGDRAPARCITCNRCRTASHQGNSLKCAQESSSILT